MKVLDKAMDFELEDFAKASGYKPAQSQTSEDGETGSVDADSTATTLADLKTAAKKCKGSSDGDANVYLRGRLLAGLRKSLSEKSLEGTVQAEKFLRSARDELFGKLDYGQCVANTETSEQDLDNETVQGLLGRLDSLEALKEGELNFLRDVARLVCEPESGKVDGDTGNIGLLRKPKEYHDKNLYVVKFSAKDSGSEVKSASKCLRLAIHSVALNLPFTAKQKETLEALVKGEGSELTISRENMVKVLDLFEEVLGKGVIWEAAKRGFSLAAARPIAKTNLEDERARVLIGSDFVTADLLKKYGINESDLQEAFRGLANAYKLTFEEGAIVVRTTLAYLAAKTGTTDGAVTVKQIGGKGGQLLESIKGGLYAGTALGLARVGKLDPTGMKEKWDSNVLKLMRVLSDDDAEAAAYFLGRFPPPADSQESGLNAVVLKSLVENKRKLLGYWATSSTFMLGDLIKQHLGRAVPEKGFFAAVEKKVLEDFAARNKVEQVPPDILKDDSVLSNLTTFGIPLDVALRIKSNIQVPLGEFGISPRCRIRLASGADDGTLDEKALIGGLSKDLQRYEGKDFRFRVAHPDAQNPAEKKETSVGVEQRMKEPEANALSRRIYESFRTMLVQGGESMLALRSGQIRTMMIAARRDGNEVLRLCGVPVTGDEANKLPMRKSFVLTPGGDVRYTVAILYKGTQYEASYDIAKDGDSTFRGLRTRETNTLMSPPDIERGLEGAFPQEAAESVPAAAVKSEVPVQGTKKVPVQETKDLSGLTDEGPMSQSTDWNCCWFFSVVNGLKHTEAGRNHLAKNIASADGKHVRFYDNAGTPHLWKLPSRSGGKGGPTPLESCVMEHAQKYELVKGSGNEEWKAGDGGDMDGACKMLGLINVGLSKEDAITADSTVDEFAVEVKKHLEKGEIVTFNMGDSHFITVTGITEKGNGGYSVSAYDSMANPAEVKYDLSKLLKGWDDAIKGKEENSPDWEIQRGHKAASFCFMQTPDVFEKMVENVDVALATIQMSEVEKEFKGLSEDLLATHGIMLQEALEEGGSELYRKKRNSDDKNLLLGNLTGNLRRVGLIGRQLEEFNEKTFTEAKADFIAYLKTPEGRASLADWYRSDEKGVAIESVLSKFVKYLEDLYSRQHKGLTVTKEVMAEVNREIKVIDENKELPAVNNDIIKGDGSVIWEGGWTEEP